MNLSLILIGFLYHSFLNTATSFYVSYDEMSKIWIGFLCHSLLNTVPSF